MSGSDDGISDIMNVIVERFNPWKRELVMGILYFIVGLLMALLGQDSLEIILIIAGAFMFVYGLLFIAASLTGGMNFGLVAGVVSVVIGILLMILPGLFSDVLMILLGIGLIIVGLITLLGGSTSFSLSTGSKVVSAIIAVLMVVMGIYALLNTDDTADIVMIVIGIITMVSGILGIYGAIQLKRLG